MTEYRIVVRGELRGALAHAFENLSLEAGAGETVLTGDLADQAELHGVLERLRDFGIELVSVTSPDPRDSRRRGAGRR